LTTFTWSVLGRSDRETTSASLLNFDAHSSKLTLHPQPPGGPLLSQAQVFNGLMAGTRRCKKVDWR
jgi:hypothetical protein